ATSRRHLPPKKQSLLTNRESTNEQIHRTHSLSAAVDSSSHDQHSQLNHISNSTISSTPMQQYSPSTFDEFQSFNRTGSPNFQQQQNEQHLFRLSL
ncbi:unnamed protein product, partial [Rotaria magnacalcarata]